jgi:poly-beta-hydroxybutyrate-responsive repressor
MHACEPRKFLQPCLLLLLLDGPSHGYDLIRRLEPYDVTHDDPGHVYRALRSLEAEGLVSSVWAPSMNGPARRVYDITLPGRSALLGWVDELQHLQALVQRYLHDFAERDRPAPRAHAGLGHTLARREPLTRAAGR